MPGVARSFGQILKLVTLGKVELDDLAAFSLGIEKQVRQAADSSADQRQHRQSRRAQ